MEDARCNNPCGLEPMGCISCTDATGISSDSVHFRDCITDEELDLCDGCCADCLELNCPSREVEE